MVDAELEAFGYSKQYHEHVTAVLRKVKDRWRMIEEAERELADRVKRPRVG